MTFWFPAFLVLFEFATYVSNDMIMPAMPAVVREFAAPPDSITLALSASLLGNVALQWFLGPLSDRKGRRTIMLTGVALFILSCIAMLAARSMAAFVALRFFQGMGVAFVAAVGYPAIHEAFDEAKAVKTISVMTSVALFAPLVGPLLGAMVIGVSSWRTIFLLIGAIGAIAFAGMAKHMPPLKPERAERVSLIGVARTYRQLVVQKEMMLAALAIGALCIPFMAWIALGPVIFMTRQHLDPLSYALRQLPVIVAMSFGCLVVGRLVTRLPLDRVARHGLLCVPLGAATMIGGRWLGADFADAIPGFVVYAVGLGVSYTSMYRLALFSADAPRGVVAAAVNSIMLLTMTAGVELLKSVYAQYGDLALIAANAGVLAAACLAGGTFLSMRNDRLERKRLPFPRTGWTRE